MSLLRVTDLHKSFGGVVATDGVDLEIEKGELHAIIGPNGAGKTTLISQLAGRLKPDSGRVTLSGRDITAMPAHKRQSIGMTRSFQITSLIMDMSVADNVALAVQSKQGHSFRFFKAARRVESLQSEALAMLDSVGLKDRASDRARALSHGEHRQLEIAVALATGTDLMLLDEPMAGLGAEESAQMIELLKALKCEKTILLIEHDMDAVFALADRISVLVYGKVIATGSPEDIRNDDAVREAYLGEA